MKDTVVIQRRAVCQMSTSQLTAEDLSHVATTERELGNSPHDSDLREDAVQPAQRLHHSRQPMPITEKQFAANECDHLLRIQVGVTRFELATATSRT